MSFVIPRLRPDTLRARLTVWHVAVLAITLSLFAALLYTSLGRTLYQHHDHELLETAEQFESLLRGVPLDSESIARAVSNAGDEAALVMVRTDRGDLLYRSPLLEIAEPNIGQHEALIHAATVGLAGPEFFTITLDRSGPVRFLCAPLDSRGEAFVQVGSPLGNIAASLHSVAVASFVLVPVVLLLTSFGGWIIAKRAMAPLEETNATLRAIQATDLTKRVSARSQDREVRTLVATINGLLDRLERAFGDLRDFAADASHQLQTPLAVMKGTIDLARRTPGRGDSGRLLDDLDEEIRDVSAVVADLQTLSLTDAGVQAVGSGPLDFSALCQEAADIIAALAEARHVAFRPSIAPDIHVSGDAVKLKQAVLNLGDNAVKYTPGGGQVSWSLARHDTQAMLAMTNSGAGIQPEELPRVFDRFYRTPSARSRKGTGLGLAIAKRIIEVHGGRIGAASTPGHETTFTVELPLFKQTSA